ncbi:MAG: FecR domain-containing protein [Phycisphaerales bacterium]|nr:MAG: FecR domain-containing protein [Phycisphaerales bacterium]
MIDCDTCRDLVEKYLDGMIDKTELAELKTHAEACETCREEFDRCALLEDCVKHAFGSQTAAEQAKKRLLARLAEEPSPRVRRIRYGPAWLAGGPAAIAATILLVIGLAVGFALGRAGSGKPAGAPLTARVPLRVSELDGTVLVRHEGTDVWRILQSDSDIYLGDTFHSTAKSGFTLAIDGESTIEVNQNSMLVLRSYNGETQFFLEHGECTAALESPHGPFFIYTPNGRAEALGTEFTVTVE